MVEDARVLTMAEAVTMLKELAMNRVPAFMRGAVMDTYKTAVREGAKNIWGGVLGKTTPNSDLAKYYTAAFAANITTSEVKGQLFSLSTGLPSDDLNARILAWRNSGGTIHMRDKMLRIPLPPAKTEGGSDRLNGIDLASRIGTSTDSEFVKIKSKQGNWLLVKRSEIAKAAKEYSKGMKRARRKGLGAEFEAHQNKLPPPWYVLKTSVTQRAWPWWDRTIEQTQAAIPGNIRERLINTLAKTQQAGQAQLDELDHE